MHRRSLKSLGVPVACWDVYGANIQARVEWVLQHYQQALNTRHFTLVSTEAPYRQPLALPPSTQRPAKTKVAAPHSRILSALWKVKSSLKQALFQPSFPQPTQEGLQTSCTPLPPPPVHQRPGRGQCLGPILIIFNKLLPGSMILISFPALIS